MSKIRSNTSYKKERVRTYRRSRIVRIPWPDRHSVNSNPTEQEEVESTPYLISKKKQNAPDSTLIDINVIQKKEESKRLKKLNHQITAAEEAPVKHDSAKKHAGNQSGMKQTASIRNKLPEVFFFGTAGKTAAESETDPGGKLQPGVGPQPDRSPAAHEEDGPAPATARYVWRRGSSSRRPPRRRFAPAAGLAGLALTALLIPAVLAWPREGTPPQPAPAAEQTAPPAGSSTGGKAPQEAAAPPAASAPDTPGPAVTQPAQVYPEPTVRVYLAETGTIDTVTLEQYVTGVLAAEMPSDFGLEALKAQAIAARTYIVKRLAAGDASGVPVSGADVTDTVDHQVYHPFGGLKDKWAELGKQEEWAKLEQAVRESKDSIMTYKGQPITASFFSTSNGYTENSEEVWQEAVPYLRSVASPWDAKIAPGFQESVTMTRVEFMNKLNVIPDPVPVSTNNAGVKPFIEVISKTEGNRIKEIRVGSKIFSGQDIRELLGLRSSEFKWSTKGNEITITTIGYGHGVGMSQWGANGMAMEGYTATEILKHYYTGISFGRASELLYKEKS
ncbi:MULTISPECIES: stage II sporulation protein D [unclassified Paenibacillus]|uniref:stage II sporulation protein D n=1 Tax=unclassified Paenibacillus TaxID=185978 RepID=UPI00089D06BB|nr:MULTISPECIES: stage II sporulation protein D [unclassified Paenibacillus]SDW84584.1 stage II sporulation protein D [Paenibacillus sp. PDC88]